MPAGGLPLLVWWQLRTDAQLADEWRRRGRREPPQRDQPEPKGLLERMDRRGQAVMDAHADVGSHDDPDDPDAWMSPLTQRLWSFELARIVLVVVGLVAFGLWTWLVR